MGTEGQGAGQGTMDTDYRRMVAEAVLGCYDRWEQPIGSDAMKQLLDAVLSVPHPDTAEVARLRQERDAHVHTLDHVLTELHAALGGLSEDASLATFPDALHQVVYLRELAEELPCSLCDDTGIAPASRFGRDEDGAPMCDEDGPCPKGCSVRPDIQVLIDEAAEVAQLRAELAEARTHTEEYHDAYRDGVADKARLTAERDAWRDRAEKRQMKYVDMADKHDALRARVADLESQLARAVVLPEDWRTQLRHHFDHRDTRESWTSTLALIESWRGGTAGEETR